MVTLTEESLAPRLEIWRSVNNPTQSNIIVTKTQAENTRRNSGRRPNFGNKEMKKELNIFTWNVRTLYRTGALRDLTGILSKYNSDVTDIQEIRWPGKGQLENPNYTLYYSCSENTFGLVSW